MILKPELVHNFLNKKNSYLQGKSTYTILCPPLSPGQFLLEQSRLGEAAEMAERAAELDSSEFDVVFSAAHMLRLVKPLTQNTSNHSGTAVFSTSMNTYFKKNFWNPVFT